MRKQCSGKRGLRQCLHLPGAQPEGSTSQPRKELHLPGPPHPQAFLKLSRQRTGGLIKGWVIKKSSCVHISVLYPAVVSSPTVDLQHIKGIFFFFPPLFSLTDVENLTRTAWSDISCEKALCLDTVKAICLNNSAQINYLPETSE